MGACKSKELVQDQVVVLPLTEDNMLMRELHRIRPDLVGKSKNALLASIRLDAYRARKAKEALPKGFYEPAHAEEKSESLNGLLAKVGHVCRTVKCVEKSKHFYVNILGAEELNRPKYPTVGCWVWLGNIQLHLIESKIAGRPNHPDAGTRVNHMSFDVFDMEACEKRLKESNVKYQKVCVNSEEEEKPIQQIFFQDPDGYFIELCDYNRFGGFIFGEYDHERGGVLAKHLNEGVDLPQNFLATCILLLAAHELKKDGQNFSRLEELFDTFCGQDKMLPLVDLQAMLNRMGDQISDSTLVALLLKMGKDDQSPINFSDFHQLIRQVVLDTPPEEIAEDLFEALDSQNNLGGISMSDCRGCLSSLSVGISKEKCNELFSEVDAHFRGSIDKVECGQLVKVFLNDVQKFALENKCEEKSSCCTSPRPSARAPQLTCDPMGGSDSKTMFENPMSRCKGDSKKCVCVLP